jgi:uncharacterized protein YggE
MNNALRRTAVESRWRLAAVVAFALLTSCAPAVAQNTIATPLDSTEEEQGIIQVSGQASVSVAADIVRITLSVETEALTAGEATRENARRMEAVVIAVRGFEIDGMDLETHGYTLRPEYEVARDGSGTRVISGYRVQNNLSVTLPDVDATGRVLDAAVEAGANRVANLSFEASDTRQARLRVLREAVANAREQAEVIAEAMGVELGMALEVQGGAHAPPPGSPGGIMFRAAAESTTPVEPGDQMVTASVTIKYRISEGDS